MPIDLYYFKGSCPCSAVMFAAKVIGVELNPKILDIRKGEHVTPDFLKINPQHTLPTIVDNGFTLWESRAIITYLQNQYGKDDSLYPKDAKKRALVDLRLYFDASTLNPAMGQHYFPTIFFGAPADPKKLENIDKALKFLDTFLESSEYVAGNNLSLADFSIVATVATLDVGFSHDLSPYKNVTRWYSKLQKIPGYEALTEHLQNLKHAVANVKNKK